MTRHLVRNADVGRAPTGKGNSKSFTELTRRVDADTITTAGADIREGFVRAGDVPDDLTIDVFGTAIKLTSKPDSPVFFAHDPERDVIVAAHVSKTGVFGTPSLERTIYAAEDGLFLTSTMDAYISDPFSAADHAKEAIDEYLATPAGDYTLDETDKAIDENLDPTTLPPAVAFADTVTVDGIQFHRSRDGILPNEPYAMRFEFDRDLTDDEMGRLAQLIGYAYAAEVRGEPLGDPIRDTSRSFVVYADTTKAACYRKADTTEEASAKLLTAIQDFEDVINDGEIFENGSPVRTTDRKGPGTKGTRLVNGLGYRPTVQVYYSDVTDEK